MALGNGKCNHTEEGKNGGEADACKFMEVVRNTIASMSMWIFKPARSIQNPARTNMTMIHLQFPANRFMLRQLCRNRIVTAVRPHSKCFRQLVTRTTTTKQQQEEPPPTHTTTTSDPPILTWVETTLPKSLIPYAQLARIDKPIGTMLLLWPCFWGVAVASSPAQHLSTLALFSTGALVMRGAGCTINDLWDRELDRSVARTRSRPLASGAISVASAVGFLAVQLSMGLGVLLNLPHTWYCFQWGCASLPLVAIYPATKRFFPYPQLVLGLTINWGVIMGWAAVHGSLDPGIVVPLYGSGVSWTLLYDTLYAHQDKKDDKKLGLQSTALTFGDGKAVLYALAALTSLQWGIVGYMAELAAVPYGVGVAAATSHLVWQVKTADLDDPHNLAERFRSNSTVGGLMFGALAAGNYFATL